MAGGGGVECTGNIPRPADSLGFSKLASLLLGWLAYSMPESGWHFEFVEKLQFCSGSPSRQF